MEWLNMQNKGSFSVAISGFFVSLFFDGSVEWAFIVGMGFYFLVGQEKLKKQMGSLDKKMDSVLRRVNDHGSSRLREGPANVYKINRKRRTGQRQRIGNFDDIEMLD